MTFYFDIYNLLLCGYVLCFIFFNFIAYLISSFYRRKFNQKSMRFGFLSSIMLFILFIPCLFIMQERQMLCRIVQTLFLVTGSIASAWNSMVLFLTMKKVRK